MEKKQPTTPDEKARIAAEKFAKRNNLLTIWQWIGELKRNRDEHINSKQ